MFPLDPKTVQRLARVIVDIDGPYERRGWQLEALLQHAGWQNMPAYDGSARVPWFIEQLESRREDRAAIERLLCRVCDPLEYDDGPATAEDFRQVINEKLQPERLVVTLVGGRPVVGELSHDGRSPTFSEPPDFEQRLRQLIADGQVVDVLMKRVTETRICEQGGAHTMAIIGIGSVVEGLLLALLLERDAELRENGFVDPRGKLVPPERASMQLLIDTAYAKDWIQLDATGFMHTVRDFRNFVHPRKELAERPDFDGDSVRLCWAPVHAVLNDLEERLG